MLRGIYFELTDLEFELLCAACAGHTNGRTDGNTTVQTCWDADRLDPGRGGIIPNARYLGTAAAKRPEIIAWATKRAQQEYIPLLVYLEWGCWRSLPPASLLDKCHDTNIYPRISSSACHRSLSSYRRRAADA